MTPPSTPQAAIEALRANAQLASRRARRLRAAMLQVRDPDMFLSALAGAHDRAADAYSQAIEDIAAVYGVK